MKNCNLIATFGLLLGTCSVVSAADILLVGPPGGDPEDDPNGSLELFLTSQGHSVTRELRKDGPEDANDFDLVIISRDTNSSSYNGPGEAAAWNAVTAPMINLSAYFYRQSVWGWDTDPLWGSGGDGKLLDTPYPNPDHPFLSGLEAPTGTILSTERNALRPKIEYLLPTGSLIVATGDSGANLGIFTIDAGTLLTNPDGVTPAGNVRIAWPMFGLYDWNFANSNGEQILNNIIATVAPEPPTITSTSIESGGGDFLVNFVPGGTNFILKSSDDLSGPYVEETSAILENDNTTFRVPAANLNPDMEFFVIEATPIELPSAEDPP